MALADDVALLQTQVAALQETTLPPTIPLCEAELTAIAPGHAHSDNEITYTTNRRALVQARLDDLRASEAARLAARNAAIAAALAAEAATEAAHRKDR